MSIQCSFRLYCKQTGVNLNSFSRKKSYLKWKWKFWSESFSEMQNLKVCCVRVSELVTGRNFITWRSASHPAPYTRVTHRMKGGLENWWNFEKVTNTNTQIQTHKYTNITWRSASHRPTLTHRMKGGLENRWNTPIQTHKYHLTECHPSHR